MGKVVRIHPFVEEDLAQIVAFQRNDPEAAKRVYQSIRRQFDISAESPTSLGSDYSQEFPHLEGIRKSVVPEFRN
jgi:plasmid stabilization system protein ParE